MSVPILIATCDTYLPAIPPLLYLLQKYWSGYPPDIIIGGFTKPDFVLPPNCTFFSIGNQADYPVEKWSDGLIKFIQERAPSVFMLLLDDMWPVRSIDTEAIRILWHYMEQFGYALKMDLCADRLYSANADRDYDYVNRLDLVKSDPDSQYQLSFMPGLWNRDHLLRALIPGETPWQAEIDGTPRVREMTDVIVLGTHQWPYRTALALRGGKANELLLDELQLHDVQELRDLGLLAHWEGE